MADLSISAVLSDDDRAAIVDDVTAAIRKVLAESSAPMLVDGNRMAELAGISRPTIDRLRADGVIPSVMVGRRRLYLPSDVIAALAANGGTDHE